MQWIETADNEFYSDITKIVGEGSVIAGYTATGRIVLASGLVAHEQVAYRELWKSRMARGCDLISFADIAVEVAKSHGARKAA